MAVAHAQVVAVSPVHPLGTVLALPAVSLARPLTPSSVLSWGTGGAGLAGGVDPAGGGELARGAGEAVEGPPIELHEDAAVGGADRSESKEPSSCAGERDAGESGSRRRGRDELAMCRTVARGWQPVALQEDSAGALPLHSCDREEPVSALNRHIPHGERARGEAHD
eukprot:748726-Hanusia_phi.AAC.1